MHTNEELADLIFPDIHETVEDLENVIHLEIYLKVLW